MLEKLCIECGKTHAFRPCKFQKGDRVKIVSNEGGYWHKDRLGEIFTVIGLNNFLRAPCDLNDYKLEGLEGAILESRLEKVD